MTFKASTADHEDMGIGGPDVVLDHEPSAGAGGGGVEPGMVELEGARALEAAHEGFDDGPVAG